MDKRLQIILRKHKSEQLYQTHVSLFGPKGKYCINRQDIDKFLEIYSHVVADSSNLAGVAEKPQPYIPVLVDVDIKRKLEEDEVEAPPIYTLAHVKRLIELYQEVLRKILEDLQPEHLYCILLQKKPYLDIKNGESYTKHGFHLHFPYVFMNRLEQENHLISRIKDLVAKAKVFEDLGFSDSASLIDTSYCKVPWLMYGGRKAADKDPYLVTKMYNDQCQEITLDQGLKEYKIFDKDERPIEMKKEVVFYLPRILSIVPYGREICQLKAGLTHPTGNARLKKKKKKTREEVRDINFQENKDMIRKLVNMLGIHRAEDRNEWMRIGWVLYNLGNGCDEARDIWCDFSSRCGEKYDEDECHTQWDRMVKKDMSIGTLRHFASVDNPELYNELRCEQVKKYIHQSLNGSHNDIARALYELYGTQFVCASMRHNIWYQFTNHHWHEIEEGVYLSQKISGEILDHYTSLSQELFTKLGSAADAGEKAMFEQRIKALMKIVNNLKSSPYKRNVMRECKEVFYDGDFIRKLNKNPYLIGFRNGVYDTRTHSFREGSPEDYISLQMAVEYKRFEEDSIELNRIKDFITKVFPDKSVREYFIDTSSDVFVGGNHSKIVQVWSGEGDNAKSITQILFEKMLGQYSVKLPTALIVGKRTQSSAACPELVRAGNGVRFAVLQEPDQKDVINIGILKELSGNDTFFARGLFKEGGEITPMFKLVLICNEPPQLPYGDKAVWNRIRLIPFESTFCDDAPDTFEEQMQEKRFPKDRAFQDKIPGMVEAFAYYLLEHRKHMKRKPEPPKVKMATESYRKKNDIYRQFIEEVTIDDESKSLSLLEMYGAFKDWFKESLPGHHIPVKNDVQIYFTKAWGEPGRGVKWKGKRLRTIQDEVEAGEAIIFEGEDFVPNL